MSKLSFLLLFLTVPMLGMEKPTNQQITTSHQEDESDFCMSGLEQELLKIVDETEDPSDNTDFPSMPAQIYQQNTEQDPFMTNLEKELLSLIDTEESGNVLEAATYLANHFMPRKKHVENAQTKKSVDELVQALLAAKPYSEPKIETKPAPAELVIQVQRSMANHEQKLNEILGATKSLDDVDSVKTALAAFQKWYPYSPEWISDLHEITLNELTKKFGFNEKFKQMALQYNTAGALTWLSKQKIACQTIPVEKLNDLVIDARVAFHNCDAPKTVALISLLNKTSFKDSAREVLCKALMGAVSTINELKNPEVMEPKVIARINILGHAGYNLEKSCGPMLMQHALKSKFPRIISQLQQHGVTNPKKPALPFFQPNAQVNAHVINLEKIYAKKDTGVSLEDFTWKACPSTKRKVAKDDPKDDTSADL